MGRGVWLRVEQVLNVREPLGPILSTKLKTKTHKNDLVTLSHPVRWGSIHLMLRCLRFPVHFPRGNPSLTPRILQGPLQRGAEGSQSKS